ncbi:UNVERIFIED_CONTAM: hypothetical protein HHA_280518 [Hammondia hammondi]|eukprot:XP_008885952.1 hypothetical protein HHA_280518 [Hammondia hammondi]
MSPKKAGKHVGRAPSAASRRRGKGKKGQRRTKVQSRRSNVTAASFVERARAELQRYNLAPKKAKKSAAKVVKKSRTSQTSAPTGGRPTHLLPVKATGTDEVGEKELWASLRAFDEENRRAEEEREERRRQKARRQQGLQSETETAQEQRVPAGPAVLQDTRKGQSAPAREVGKQEERDWSQMTRNERRKLRLRRELLAARASRAVPFAATKCGEGKERREEEKERGGEKRKEKTGKKEGETTQQNGTEEEGESGRDNGVEAKAAKRYRSEVLDDEEAVFEVKKKKVDSAKAVAKEQEKVFKSEAKNRVGQCPVVRRKGEAYGAFAKRVDAWARESLRTSAPATPAEKAKELSTTKRRKETKSISSKTREEEESRGQRPVFGEVVDRPPELKQFKDSFARFKAKAQNRGSPISPSPAKKESPSKKHTAGEDALSGEASQVYVQQVRAAYATVKAKRREKAGEEAKLKAKGKGLESSGQDASYTRPGWVASSSSLYDSQWIGVGRYKPLDAE